MATIEEVIYKLEKLRDEHGDVELTIYRGFNKETTKIDTDQIYYDEVIKDVYIGIYN